MTRMHYRKQEWVSSEPPTLTMCNERVAVSKATYEISKVTCHECLDYLIVKGEQAARRLKELENETNLR